MKLNEVRPNVETSGDWEEEFFSIKDQGMIFDILRSKMYSNPILAICREISCNARDAHREVGKSQVPIQITLPNHLEKYYKIKDFGPGISPDRMVNIFIKYTASTKRDDNLQTGGFGLGAKTPFAYSESFSIITVHNGIRYQYACIIDATKIGKMMKGSETPTTEPNGTEIIIPVKEQDFKFFADWTEQATRHWDVRPVIKGGSITYQTSKKILEGKDWAIVASRDYNRSAKMIIDGIEYPLQLDSLKKYADAKLIDSARGDFLMYFGVGELTLSASREQIYLDKQTQDKIRHRMDIILAEIQKNVNDKIDAFPDLWQANVYYRKELSLAFHTLTFLGKLKWKGIELHSEYIDINCPSFTFSKGRYAHRKNHDPNKITRSGGRSLSFDETSVLYVNDLPLKEPTPRHVKKACEDNPKLANLQLICPNDKVSIADLNKSIHLDKMQPVLLSTITKASSRNYTPATSRLLVFRFDSPSRNFRQVPYASLEEDANGEKVLCYLSKDANFTNRQVKLKNKKNLSVNSLYSLLEKNPNTSVYGIDENTPAERVEEDFSEFIDIEDFLDEKVLSNKKINYVEIKYTTTHSYKVDDRLLAQQTKLGLLVKDPNSLCLKVLELYNKIKDSSRGDLGLLEIYESVNGVIDDKQIKEWIKNNPQWNVDEFEKKYLAKYPLLNAINTYNYSQIVEHVAQYINLIDQI
jgi:Histidine kinase-, DNA gyrase B-, and HSP90-like ATPase